MGVKDDVKVALLHKYIVKWLSLEITFFLLNDMKFIVGVVNMNIISTFGDVFFHHRLLRFRPRLWYNVHST